MKLDSLEDLLYEELRDLYDAEKQIARALPKMAKKAAAPALAQAFTRHLEETKGQIARLEQAFEELGKKPRGKKCEGVEGLLEEGKEILGEEGDPAVKDAALIGAAQKVEHYEMAGYGTVRTWAERLGLKKVARLLQQTLDEEKATDEKLTRLAGQVNAEASAPAR